MEETERVRRLADLELGAAERELALGNYSGVDVLCHDVLRALPGDPEARRILDTLRERLRLTERGGVWVRPQAKGVEPAYLLIKAWGFGFWADINQVLGGLLLAEITGRTPVVYWGANSLFGDGKSDAFRSFWRPVSGASLEEVRKAMSGGVFPAKWTSANLEQEDLAKWEGEGSRLGGVNFLGRPEPVAVLDFYASLFDLWAWIPTGHRLHGRPIGAVYADLVQRYLVPCEAVRQGVEAFAADKGLGHDVLAVHIRGSDKYRESLNNEKINDQIVRVMDAEPAGRRFFLLTDDARWLDFLKQRYGERLIATICQRTGTDLGPHYIADVDRTALGREVMIDTYLAMRCGGFVGNGRSSVSNMIGLLKAWPQGASRIFDRPVLFDPGIALHVPQGVDQG